MLCRGGDVDGRGLARAARRDGHHRLARRPDPYVDGCPAGVDVLPGDGTVTAGPRGRCRCALPDRGDISTRRQRSTAAGASCAGVVRPRPDLFGWAHGSETARLRREALVVPPQAETDEALDALRVELGRRVRRCAARCTSATSTPAPTAATNGRSTRCSTRSTTSARLGIFFTASPRHADILLVTGIGADGMAGPLRRTLEAMPGPTVVIAAGTDAVSGGLIGSGYTGGTGISGLVPVDVWVPGSPASPFSLLHGILLALDRVPTTVQGAS